MQVQDTHEFASRIESSFNHHETLSTNNLSTILNMMTMKENEHESIERISAYAFVVELLFE
jgi:hypothetical protein